MFIKNVLKLLLNCIILSKITVARIPMTKEWIHDVNFESPQNWIPNRVPCPMDRIIYSNVFDQEIQLTQRNILAREIILPRRGSIKLENNAVIELTNKKFEFENCPGEDMIFKELINEPWLLSSNWKLPKSAKDNRAIPHFDRIPCQDDQVVFKKEKKYVINMPKRMQYVKSIGDGQEKFTPKGWRLEVQQNPLVYQDSDSDVSPSVLILPEERDCSSKESCICQNDSSYLELCENEISKGCPPANCRDPVLPKHHCCEICGGVLVFREPKNFDVGQMRQKTEKLVKEWGVDGVDWYISTVDEHDNDYEIQMVIVDKEMYDGRSVELAKRLQEHFNKSLTFVNSMKLSGYPWNGSKGGWEMLIMFFVVAIFFVGVYVYYYTPFGVISTRSFGSLGFARFENRSREGSLALGISHISLDKAFDNPMYDKNSAKQGEEEFKDEPLYNSDTDEEQVSEKGD